MSSPLLRPPVQNLIFQLYGRPLHPELFEIAAECRIRHKGDTIIVRITSTGHVITWENEDVILTEVTADEQQPLPSKRLLLSDRLRNEQCRSMPCADGAHYQTSFQVETLEAEIFLHVHQELLSDGRRKGLLHRFPRETPFSLAPLGLVNVEASTHCLFLTCFHTFPEEHTIIKTQSLIEKK